MPFSNEAPEPPLAQIIATSVDDGRLVVEFDLPIDGSALDPGWIDVAENPGAVWDFFSQVNATTIELSPDTGTVNAGDHWSIAIEQAGIAFPQSGVVS